MTCSLKRAVLAVAIVFLGLTSLPADAGTIYVPQAVDQVIDGRLYQTEVWATNLGAQGRRFETYFIPSLSNGVNRPEEIVYDFTGVPPQSSILAIGAAPQGEIGMLEIAGAPQLNFDARLRVFDEGGQLLSSTRVPTISDGDVHPGGDLVALLGLKHSSSGSNTSVGLINMSQDPNECAISLVKASGEELTNTFVTTMMPLSHREIPDVFGLLGLEELAAGRAVVTCAEDFYAYAVVWQDNLDQVLFVQPGDALSSDLVRPGDEPPVPTLEMNGNFFTATPGDSIRELALPLEPGVSYDRIVIDFDLRLGRYQNGLFHAICSLRRLGGPPLYFGLFARGSNARTILDRGDGTDLKVEGPWTANQQVHVQIIYDAAAGRFTLNVSRAGTVFYSTSTFITFRDISNNGNPVGILLGQARPADGGAYQPPLGWTYSNLKVQAFVDE
ncbi:MAG: hypothetical protein SX243_05905 [Acidobacteriota bacterium]|nr:hypothetical protein [Acidobacteriota bacterium]